jgi:hypothetical protein
MQTNNVVRHFRQILLWPLQLMPTSVLNNVTVRGGCFAVAVLGSIYQGDIVVRTTPFAGW